MILRLASRLKRLAMGRYAALITALLAPTTRAADDVGGLVYDVGFHIGQDTAFYLQKGFRVVAIEADPELVRRGRLRFATEIARGQLQLLNCGVTEEAGPEPLTFHVNTVLSEWSSFDPAVAGRAGHPLRPTAVPCATLASIVHQYGEAVYVKIDIEGNDLPALRSLLSCEHPPRYLSVENGHMGMLELLTEAGYTAFKYVQQRDVPRQRPPRPPRHGRYVKPYFPMGSSGLFGEEAPGDWLDATAVRKLIAAVWNPDGPQKNPGHIDERDGWFDLHAQRNIMNQHPKD